MEARMTNPAMALLGADGQPARAPGRRLWPGKG